MLILGDDLLRGFLDPGRPPTQSDLDSVLDAATSVSVRPAFSSDEESFETVVLFETVVYETDDPSDLASLRDALRIEGEMGHCMCVGEVAFVFRRDGEELRTVTLHHGESLRWEPFFYNAPLVESDPILDWLSARGVPGPRQEYEDDRRRTREYAAEEKRWRAAMPAALQPLWPSMTGLADEWPEAADVMRSEYPDPVERARVLMEWYGRGQGPWSGYPAYEEVPEWCLLRMPLEVLVRAAQAEPRSAELREGAGRLFAGWSFGKERGDDLAEIPGDLKRALLGHALESADEDKRARALWAFGDETP